MNYKRIDESIKPLFQSLEEMGILLDEKKLLSLIQGFQKRLAEQKQVINREVGFMVNLYSEDHWNRAIDEVKGEDLLLGQLIESKNISSLIRKLQQVCDLANGNYRVLGRHFGLYPKYEIDSSGKIITVGELSLDDFPKEVLSIVSYPGKMLIKTTYSNIILNVARGLYGDSCYKECLESDNVYESMARYVFGDNLRITSNSDYDVFSFFGRSVKVQDLKQPEFVMRFLLESTAMDLVKMGFVNLFEDYRIGKLGCQIFAIAEYSVYLFAPCEHADLISLIVRECLESVHSDFSLQVDVTMGISLDKLV